MEGERHFIRVSGAPRNNAFELGGVVGDLTDRNQFRFNFFGVPHVAFRIARRARDSRPLPYMVGVPLGD